MAEVEWVGKLNTYAYAPTPTSSTEEPDMVICFFTCTQDTEY